MLNGLPWQWPLMREVIRKHLSIILLLLLMGLIFSTIGGLTLWFAKDGATVIYGLVFLLSGLGLMVLNVYLNYSSCMYYYEQALLKQYGKTVEAIVTNKIISETLDKNGTANTEDDVVETDLSIQYQFVQTGKTYEGESFISELALYEAIEIGAKVPVIVMRDHPNISRLQTKKLKRQLNISAKSNTPENVSISESLIDED
ncbi:MAG TPA: hypothetical protein PL131_09985 [Methylotenera sp.]|nr:hypothetical protein [Methylotenera sp.]HPH06193.1 hypothetical protein [Methylotenera sp.]HPN02060.1 hypothetical protein [Methylotenera sp.]